MAEEARSKPTAIAAAAPGMSSTAFAANGDSEQPTMPYTCQTCAKRKIKCDKTIPVCSSCRKGKVECLYQAPPPRRRKRKLSGETNERLAEYERILNLHGLLPDGSNESHTIEEAPPEQPSLLRFDPSAAAKPGKLLTRDGQSRYLDSNFWRKLGEDDMQHMSDDDADDEDQTTPNVIAGIAADPLTSAFMGAQQNLLHFHPTHEEAMRLWKVHSENVEPLTKILHIPSTTERIENASREPALASKTDECLMFAVYHFAVFSMTADECQIRFHQPKATLRQKFDFAARQALVNASFLKTTEMIVLQALVLYLMAYRNSCDPHLLWILTGTAVRIAQRMGLHKDAESLGMLPFDVQMRRRLFYQVVPLDGMASQMAGVNMEFLSQSWDTQPPLNINDDEIWPGMTQTPREQQGATEMMFCLTRATLGKFMVGTGRIKDFQEAEPVINEAEREVEEKYIRYCDVINPLHFLSISLARSAISAMRLRTRLPKSQNQIVSIEETRILLQLSQKILDTDSAAYSNLSLRKYMWHVNGFFAWGSWDSLIFILTTLRKENLLTPSEVDSAWTRVEQVYTNHAELLEAKRAVQIAMGRLTIRAWKNNPPRSSIPEPAYISSLRSFWRINPDIRADRHGSIQSGITRTDTNSSLGPSPSTDASALFGSLSNGINLDLDKDFNLDTADWMFWEQLIKDYQVPSNA